MIRRRETLFYLMMLPVVASCAKKEQKPVVGPLRPKIAVIPRGGTSEFWRSVHAGAAKTAQEFGNIDLIWKGPAKDDDVKGQIEVVESMIAQGVHGIALAPISDTELVAPVKAAVAAKIPVAIIDSPLQGTDPVSFVSSDNRAAGIKAAAALNTVLGGEGKVAVLRHVQGSPLTTASEEAFLRVVRGQYQTLTVVSSDQFGGATVESAAAASEALLAAQHAADGGLNGVFCPSEPTTLGMLLALQKTGLAGKVKLVGAGAAEKLVQGLRDGHLEGLAVQDAFKMGSLALGVLSMAIQGRKPEAYVDAGMRFVAKNELEDPAVKEMLRPDVKKWLKE